MSVDKLEWVIATRYRQGQLDNLKISMINRQYQAEMWNSVKSNNFALL